MKNYAAIGTCPVCSQGRLLIARDESSSELYVVCEECEAEWADPEAAKEIDAATRNAHGRSTMLQREELVGHPWEAFLW
jgi:hypothetical protein